MPPKSRLPGSVNNFLRIIKIIQLMRYKIYEITESCVKKKKDYDLPIIETN